jgi:hypothetical protein
MPTNDSQGKDFRDKWEELYAKYAESILNPSK